MNTFENSTFGYLTVKHHYQSCNGHCPSAPTGNWIPAISVADGQYHLPDPVMTWPVCFKFHLGVKAPTT